ncbi:MAG: sulfatase [Candidatus Aminicenantales bacterium]
MYQAPENSKKTRPNIILIVIDALRARSLSCYGGDEGRSRSIDALAEGGVLFEDVYSAWNTTDQSLTTILTGRYPRTHGIVRQGYRVKPEDIETFEKLEVKLLSEILQQEGYSTIAIDWMSRWFEKGYDYYGYKPEGNLLDKIHYHLITLPAVHVRYILRSLNILQIYSRKRKFSLKRTWMSIKDVVKTFLFTFELARIQDVAYVRGLAENLLRKIKKRPFFLFLHIWDTHHPYHCPQSFIEKEERYLDSKELLRKQYLGAVRYVDYQLGKFFRHLKEKKMMDETFIIVTSDHGESLTEHDIYFDHHGLYDETTHVPLIFHFPGAFPRGKKVKGFVQHVDILPTVCELLGIEESSYHFDGKSLFPLIRGEVDEIRPFVLSEESYAQRKMSLREEGFKYIYAPDNEGMCIYCLRVHGGKEELYDLENDPAERRNIAPRRREKSRVMKDKLLSVIRSLNTKREKQLVLKEIDALHEEEGSGEAGGILAGDSISRFQEQGGGSMKKKEVKIELPEETVEGIRRRIKDSEFETVEEYLSFLVQKFFQRKKRKTKLTTKEERKIRKKLQSLGYID